MARIIASNRLNTLLAILVALLSNAGCIPESAVPVLPSAQPADAQPAAQVQDGEPAAAPRARLAGRWKGQTHCDGQMTANGIITPIAFDSGSVFQLEINDVGRPSSLPLSLGIGNAEQASSVFGVGSTQTISGASEVNGMVVTYEGSITVTKAEFADAMFSVAYDIRMTQRAAGQTTTGIGTQSVEVTLRDGGLLEYVNRLAVDWTMTFESPAYGTIASSYHQDLVCSTDLIQD